jgi:hypothetical protein
LVENLTLFFLMCFEHYMWLLIPYIYKQCVVWYVFKLDISYCPVYLSFCNIVNKMTKHIIAIFCHIAYASLAQFAIIHYSIPLVHHNLFTNYFPGQGNLD